MNALNIKAPLYAALFFLLTVSSGSAYADDTQIYFSGGSSNTAEVRPNVLLILDSSGSMGWSSGTAGKTRMQEMRAAMLTIINSMEGVNVGLMRFTDSQGGPVLFPISYIDDPASVAASEPDESQTTLSLTISDGDNDAQQIGTGVNASLTDTTLEVAFTAATAANTNEIEIQRVSSSEDDAYEYFGNMTLNSYFWPYNGGNNIDGARFIGIDIPQGATINSATFELTSVDTVTLTMDLYGEDVDDSKAFSTSSNDLSTRVSNSLTTNKVNNWNVPTTAVVSQDVTDIVKEIINRPGWSSGNALTIISNDESSSRRFHSFDTNSASAPKLTIDWNNPGNATSIDHSIALRFPTIDIPQGATITSAKLTLTSKDDRADAATWIIRAEDADTSTALAATNNNISARTLTSAANQLEWVVPSMSSDTSYTTCDSGTCTGNLKDVINEVTSRAGWCGGNDLTLIINNKAGSTGKRNIHSFESDSTFAPKLEITYDATTGGCYKKTETAQIAANYDDVEEDSSGSIQRTSGDLDFSSKLVGLRFQEIDIPKNATIVSATIQVNADGTSTANPNPTIEIWGIDEDDTDQFPSGVPDYLSDIAKVDKNIDWALGDFTTSGAWYTSPDIKDIVQDIVNRTNWTSGNAMGFVFEKANKTRAAETHDDNPSESAKLSVTYQATATSASSITTVRDRLIELVNDIPTSGNTPIVETLYEAARYWRGESVIYGKTRSGESKGRISHPGSYCEGDNDCGGANTTTYPPYGIYTPAGCSTTNLNDSDCKNRSIQGSPTYISPFNSTLTCQSNYQVLLTDGDANSNNIENKGDISFISGSGACQTTGTNRGTFADGEECGVDIVDYINNNDQNSTLSNDQTVGTYTIGFNTSGLTNATNYLKDLAIAGGGTFNEASTADGLVSVFSKILEDVRSDPTSFVAPSLATNAFNRLLSRDEVYFGLFTPSYNKSWQGNAKKYNVCVSSGGYDEDTSTTDDNCTLGNILARSSTGVTIPDVNAIDTTTNKFRTDVASVWSDIIDGRETVKGGAGGEITDYTAQKFYTEATSSGTQPASGTSLAKTANSGYQIDVDTWDDTDTAHIRALVCPTVSTAANSDCEDRMLWILGKIIDADVDSDTSATSRWSMNDVLHSSPSVVTYGGTDSDADGVVDTFFDRIVVGTNDGALRFINGTTGKQEWEFIPQQMLGEIKNHFTNAESDHQYGLDTTPTLRINDVDNDGTIEPADGDFVHVYIAMRRGGNFIYALDITPSTTLSDNTTSIIPKYLWRIEGGTAGFELLKDTWSPPKVATIDTTSGEKEVLIFGGGYDTDFDNSFDPTYVSGDNRGNAVFIVDPDDGSKIFSVGGLCSGCSGSFIPVTDMKYSIPSRITILDTDGDGFDDRLYFGDVGGQVWRIDLADDVKLSGSGREGSTVAGKLAYISTPGTSASERKFFEPPSVVQVKDYLYSDAANGEYDYILIGTGDRANPLETAVNNRFYAFRDKFIDSMPDTDTNNLADSNYPQASAPISHSIVGNMIDVTTSILDSSDSTHKAALGWYYDFASSGTTGEKVLAAPTTIAGTVFFTTYLPEDSTADACAANVGSGSALNFNVLTTKASLDWDEDGSLEDLADRRKALGGGIPSDVVPIFTKEGVVGIVGIEGGAAQLGTLAGLPRYRTYWYEEM